MSLRKILSGFRGKKILVIGDLMLDRFIWGSVSRVSPEAPVPILEMERETLVPGGAANAVHNLRDLGARVFVTGVIGSDGNGKELRRELKAMKIEINGLITDKKRPTTLKTRVISRNQQLIRIDREVTAYVPESITNKILEYTERVMEKTDAVLISDYGKGVITDDLVENIVSLGKKAGKNIVVDPNIRNFLKYEGVDVFTCNAREASSSLGITPINETSFRNMGHKLLSRLNCKSAVITKAEEGMSVFMDNKVVNIPAVDHEQEIVDVTGAGDTVVSAITLGIASGAGIIDSARIANYAAAIVLRKVGTATATRREIEELMHELKCK